VGKMRNLFTILVGKSEGNKLLERPKHRWEDNIKMDIKVLGRERVGWIHLAQNRTQCVFLVNTIPPNFIKDGKFLDWLRDYHLLKKDSASWNTTSGSVHVNSVTVSPIRNGPLILTWVSCNDTYRLF
jgi:hypothetical protein